MNSTETINKSFQPIASAHTHTLVLGTMPGQRSLLAQQYYAHPRNALWPILCAIVTGEVPRYSTHQEISYPERCKLICKAGYSLWDVLDSCKRPGSLDGNIVRDSELPNRIPDFIDTHPHLSKIIFNGRTAEKLFRRHIQPELKEFKLTTICLPSTSPAMASLTLQAKFTIWHKAIVPEN